MPPTDIDAAQCCQYIAKHTVAQLYMFAIQEVYSLSMKPGHYVLPSKLCQVSAMMVLAIKMVNGHGSGEVGGCMRIGCWQ